MEESDPASYYEFLLGHMVRSEYSRIRFRANLDCDFLHV